MIIMMERKTIMIMRIVESYNSDYGKGINNDNDDWKENNNDNVD